MYYFRDDPDVRPPSILITTLASWAYVGQTDLFTAAKAAAANMNSKIGKVDGKWCVLNPAVDGENFADKWNDYPERRQAYFDWHSDLCHTLDDLSGMRGAGLPTVTARLAKSFGLEPVQGAAIKVGKQLAEKRSMGNLRMRTGGLLSTGSAGVILPEHQFYGRD